jgi:hypothetical protein
MNKATVQRQAELLIDMGCAADGEAMPRAQERLAESEWLQRLMARARLVQGDAQDALTWIESALKRLKAEHFRSEFLELLRHSDCSRRGRSWSGPTSSACGQPKGGGSRQAQRTDSRGWPIGNCRRSSVAPLSITPGHAPTFIRRCANN